MLLLESQVIDCWVRTFSNSFSRLGSNELIRATSCSLVHKLLIRENQGFCIYNLTLHLNAGVVFFHDLKKLYFGSHHLRGTEV